MIIETPLRSMSKAFSWRVLGTIVTAALGYALTQRLRVAFFIGALDFVAKTFLYFVHERFWNRVNFGRHNLKPTVVWFSGLSGAGKTTIAEAVCAKLRSRGVRVEHLDGDSVRNFFPTVGFTRPERLSYLQRMAFLASRLESHGIFVIASFVTPYQESRDFVRKTCRNVVEVYVSTPLEECERRDVKGLYQKARRGEINNFTGISDAFEIPTSADLTIDTREQTVEQSAEAVLGTLRPRRGKTVAKADKASAEKHSSHSLVVTRVN